MACSVPGCGGPGDRIPVLIVRAVAGGACASVVLGLPLCGHHKVVAEGVCPEGLLEAAADDLERLCGGPIDPALTEVHLIDPATLAVDPTKVIETKTEVA